MDATEHYRRLERLYHQANVQQLFEGSSISVSHSKAEITLPVESTYFHGGCVYPNVVFPTEPGQASE